MKSLFPSSLSLILQVSCLQCSITQKYQRALLSYLFWFTIIKSHEHVESAHLAYKGILGKATNLQNLVSLSSTKKHKIYVCLSGRAKICMSLPDDIYSGPLLLLLFKPTAHESQNQRRTSYSGHELYLLLADRWRGPILELFLVFNQCMSQAKYKNILQVSTGTKPVACQLNGETITCH